MPKTTVFEKTLLVSTVVRNNFMSKHSAIAVLGLPGLAYNELPRHTLLTLLVSNIRIEGPPILTHKSIIS